MFVAKGANNFFVAFFDVQVLNFSFKLVSLAVAYYCLLKQDINNRNS